jgi:hypothetical protein
MDQLKKIVIVIAFLCTAGLCSYAQNYNEEKTAMTNFIVRMYKANPFEGVKVFTDYEHSYLLSVLSLDPAKYPNSSALNRVAGVKAMSQASRYFNGSKIDSDLIVRGVEHSDGTADSEIIETIREKSAGYVKALELLTSFDSKDQRKVFIYCKEIVIENNN